MDGMDEWHGLFSLSLSLKKVRKILQKFFCKLKNGQK